MGKLQIVEQVHMIGFCIFARNEMGILPLVWDRGQKQMNVILV